MQDTKHDLSPEASQLLGSLAKGSVGWPESDAIFLERLPLTDREPVAFRAVDELRIHRLALPQRIADYWWGVVASPLGLAFAAASESKL